MRGPFKPSFGLSGVVTDPKPPLGVISPSTCRRQVKGEMTRQKSPWMQGPDPDFLQTLHWREPRVRLSMKKGA
jgi:hypothetical protein